MKRILLFLTLLAVLKISSFAQATHSFSTSPTFIDYPGIPSWKISAEVTSNSGANNSSSII